ncbi:hypothetical protein ACHFJ0_05145 [Paracoccus sp. NGMCC 1.201697]|uniref:Uncharacterized protein n=1 Tax=Paracoccus broussonetiae subsp. drimophilus TaxID=3373869 RepID=A0ABW7LHL7_9RHOB
MTETWHWHWSCRINACLGGRADEPLCSRVFRQPNSAWRSAYLRTADWAFGEEYHCLHIHLRWLTLKYA